MRPASPRLARFLAAALLVLPSAFASAQAFVVRVPVSIVTSAGEPPAMLVLSPQEVNFGDLLLGDKVSREVTVRNASAATMSLQVGESNRGALSVQTNCGVLAPSATCTIEVTAEGRDTGRLDGQILVEDTISGIYAELYTAGRIVMPAEP